MPIPATMKLRAPTRSVPWAYHCAHRCPGTVLPKAEAVRGGQSGLTLIETLVAFAILSSIILSVSAIISQAARLTLSAEERLLASIAADNLVTAELASERTRFDDNGEIVLAGRTFTFEREAIDASDETEQITYRIRLAGSAQAIARVDVVKLKQ